MQQEVDFELFFLSVLSEVEELQFGERWIIPSESFMPQILEHFGLSSEQFKRRFQVHARHFARLWKYSSKDRNLVLNKGKLVRGETTYRVLTNDPEFIAIHGWISTDELNAMISTKSPTRSSESIEPSINSLSLYHVTSLDGLYAILKSGYIEARSKTGVAVGFSPYGHQDSGNWVYLGLNPELPSPGNKPVQLVLSSKLLKDRKDYYLNYTWSYGKTASSLHPDQLNRFLGDYKPLESEIIFENPISIAPYLIAINVVQLPTYIIEKIPPEHRIVVNWGQIPDRYTGILHIIDTLGTTK